MMHKRITTHFGVYIVGKNLNWCTPFVDVSLRDNNAVKEKEKILVP